MGWKLWVVALVGLSTSVVEAQDPAPQEASASEVRALEGAEVTASAPRPGAFYVLPRQRPTDQRAPLRRSFVREISRSARNR